MVEQEERGVFRWRSCQICSPTVIVNFMSEDGGRFLVELIIWVENEMAILIEMVELLLGCLTITMVLGQ